MSAVLSGGPISFAVANTVELRSGTSPQTLRVYNTYTDASNYERGTFFWNSNTLTIGTEQAGTGVARSVGVRTGGTTRWVFSSSGDFLAFQDATYDIGASGATRPRRMYLSSYLVQSPGASVTPANNGELVMEATSNTSVTIKLKGSDGTVRTNVLTLT